MSQLNTILEQELNRKEFLQYLGAFVLTLVGVSGFLKNIGNLQSTKRPVAAGYGSSPYGGKNG